MTCKLYNSIILNKEDIDKIRQDHAGFFVEGLSFSEQRSIVKGIANELYRQGLKEKKPDFKKLEERLKEVYNQKLTDRIQEVSNSIEMMNDIGGDTTGLNIFLEKQIATKNNINLLFTHANDLLLSFQGIIAKEKYNDIIEDNEQMSEEEEAVLERTTFSDNFYFQLDSKNTTSSQLKKFLAFIPAYTYDNNKVKKPVETIIGTQDYLEFDYAFNELHRILAGTKPNRKEIIDLLQLYANTADEVGNNNLAWLSAFVEYFNTPGETDNEEDIKESLRKQFTSEMAKHNINMQFVLYSKQWHWIDKKAKTGYYTYTARLTNDNSGSTAARLLDLWKKEHSLSNIVRDGQYDSAEIERLKNAVVEVGDPNKGYTDVDRLNKTYNILSQIGITPNRKFLEAIFLQGKSFKYGNREIDATTLIGNKGLLTLIFTAIPKNSTLETYNLTGDNIVKWLASNSAAFERDEFSNSFRVGDKTVYSYSMNQYLVNRVRDLKNDPKLREKLSKTLFAKESLYLSILNGEDQSGQEFRDWFDESYVSLSPLKIAKGNRSDEVTEISELEHEVTKIAWYNTKYNYNNVLVGDKSVKARNAEYFFLTTSDKSNIRGIKGLAFDCTQLAKQDDKDTIIYTKEALDLFLDFVVIPEVNRIVTTTNTNFKDNLNLASYNGGKFWMLPFLNDITETITDEEGKKSTILILDEIKAGKFEQYRDRIREEVRKYLIRERNRKLVSWKRLGIIDDNYKLSHIESNKKRDNDVLTATEIAMDYVFNYHIANINNFQLIVGDPSQYAKGDSIEDTYANIGKRLAAEIAPGIEYEGPDYIQIFAQDIKIPSLYALQFLKQLDGVDMTMEQWNKLSKDQKKTYKAAPYFEMTSTDAQEYTTWKEHLGILRDMGRITQNEYNEAHAAFSKGEEPSEEVFNKVLQPLKPVYVYNSIEQVGSQFIDVKTYIKSSSFPLIPTLTKGLDLDNLRKEMEDLEDSKGKYADGVDNPEKLTVRLSYKTAVKVGFPAKAVEMDFNNLDFKGKTKRLSRAGFRIQQDVPHDPNKKEIGDGSQAKKLLFANYDNPELEQEYTDLYKRLYLHGKKKLQSRLFKEGTNEIDNVKLSKILIQELKSKGETSKPLFDGLIVENGEFVVPLWMSEYADKYMSLLTAMVKNSVVSHKFPGKKFVLGSNAGFKKTILEGKEGEDYIKETTGIIFTDSYDSTKGLTATYWNPEAPVGQQLLKYAQVIAPFKFFDNNGNLLHITDFLVKGTNKIDHNKLPKELLDLFGFRIPTQMDSSMSEIEIVGFLPHTSGDLIIAPAEFTIKMGSDFDVDALYNYMYATKYDRKTKSFSKIEFKEDVSEVKMEELLPLRKHISSLGLDYAKIEDYIYELSLNENLPKQDLIYRVQNLYPEFASAVEDSISKYNRTIEKYVDSYLDWRNAEQEYLNGVKNRILDIRLKVITDKALQGSSYYPLGMGRIKEMISKLEEGKVQEGEVISILSDEYQKMKFYDGVSGKNGVGMFSIDSIFNVLAQGKGMVLREWQEIQTDKGKVLVKMPAKVAFGNRYKTSNKEEYSEKEHKFKPVYGDLSDKYTLKIQDKPRYKTEVIAAFQNLSVDNANEQGMHKINLNSFTFGVYSILNFLGFEEDISVPFMSQPIIIEYVERMRNANSILKEYDPKAEEKIVEELINKYSNNTYYNPDSDTMKANKQLADFYGLDAEDTMLRLIKEKRTFKGKASYDMYQASILDKFMRLKELNKPLGGIKKLLNIDSKGFAKDMLSNIENRDNLYDMSKNLVQNAKNLFGYYHKDEEGNLEIIPTTTAGFDTIYGLNTLIDTFGPYFFESTVHKSEKEPGLQFVKIVNQIKNISGKPRLSEKAIKDIKVNYKKYLLSNLIKGNDVESLRKELFLDKTFYNELLDFQKSKIGRENTFIRDLKITWDKVGNFLEVDFNNAGGDNFDESNIYKSLVELFVDSNDRDGIIPSEIAEKLTIYAILRGGNKAQSFLKFIPIYALNKIIDIPKNNFDPQIFVNQYIQHNPKIALLVTGGVWKDNYWYVLPKEQITGDYIRVLKDKKEYLLKYVKQTQEGNYAYVVTDKFGEEGFSEYVPNKKYVSILKINNDNPGIKPDHNLNPFTYEYIKKDDTTTVIPEVSNTTSDIFTKLNTKDLQSLVQNIADLNIDEYPQAKLAKVLARNLDPDTKLEFNPTGSQSYYRSAVNTVTIGGNAFKTNDQKINNVLHEVLHSVTESSIETFENGGKLEPRVVEALTRLNDFKEQLIQTIVNKGGKEVEDFKRAISYWINELHKLDLQDGKDRLDFFANRKTVNGSLKSFIKQSQNYFNNPESFSDTSPIYKFIHINDEITEEQRDDFQNNFKKYYSLFNLSEFLATAGSNEEARSKLMELSGGKYLDKIKNFFKEILEFLGLKSDETAKFLDDIFAVASVKDNIEQEEYKYTTEKVGKLNKPTGTKSLFTDEEKMYIEMGIIHIDELDTDILSKIPSPLIQKLVSIKKELATASIFRKADVLIKATTFLEKNESLMVKELQNYIKEGDIQYEFDFNPIVSKKSNQIDYTLSVVTALNKINRNKFTKDKLQGWLNDLQKQGVSKAQLELFKETAKDGMTKEEIIASLIANYSYTVEINTAKEKSSMTKEVLSVNGFSLNNNDYKIKKDDLDPFGFEKDIYTKNNKEITEQEYRDALYEYNYKYETNTQHYSNLTVPGGTNYTENRIVTPQIVPSIRGHAQFAEKNDLGWSRSDDRVIYNMEHIDFVMNELEKSGQLKIKCD